MQPMELRACFSLHAMCAFSAYQLTCSFIFASCKHEVSSMPLQLC